MSGGLSSEIGRHAGLCAICAHAKALATKSGSPIFLCSLWAKDPRFKKYPPLPMVRCEGWAPPAP